MKLTARAFALLLRLGIVVDLAPHPDLAAYAPRHPVTVIAGRVNARRFIDRSATGATQ